ncbi:sulfotransferase 1C4-like [Lytechinus variegatus]|uniref:sulfotransferase 1C4-like n=1 Tax=Lytechinus variegatus TaxID=7654 RepID=UPI001BB0F07B|nr:sulfotransferase 1C4-like [Lytechinus variegatus]XP_041480796.1 sulfotransferase 1C4-like [Lytechinus variegatus]
MAEEKYIPPFAVEHQHKGIWYPGVVLDSSIDRMKTFEMREDDVFIVTYPKAGTHWMMEIVGLILSNGYPDKIDRSLYSSTIEMFCVDQKLPRSKKEEEEHPIDWSPFMDVIDKAPSPRVFMTHLIYDLLPKDLLKAKVVYVARNPKDLILSWYNFAGKNPGMPFTMDDAINKMINDEVHWGPWPQHVRQFWDLRDHENVTFVFYEDLKKEPAKYIQKVASGIGRPLSEEVLQRVVKFSHIDAQRETFNKMAESGKGNLVKVGGTFTFINKGVSGRWKQHFTVAQNEAFDEWYKSKMADTDLKFTFE